MPTSFSTWQVVNPHLNKIFEIPDIPQYLIVYTCMTDVRYCLTYFFFLRTRSDIK